MICSNSHFSQPREKQINHQLCLLEPMCVFCLTYITLQSVNVQCFMFVCVRPCHRTQRAHYRDRSVRSHLDQWFSPASISSSRCQSVWSHLGVVWVICSSLAAPLKTKTRHKRKECQKILETYYYTFFITTHVLLKLQWLHWESRNSGVHSLGVQSKLWAKLCTSVRKHKTKMCAHH